MHPVIRLLQSKWNDLNPTYKKYFLIGFPTVVFIFLVVMLFTLAHQDTQLSKLMVELENKQMASTVEQINGMRSQIEKLAANTKDSSSINQMNQELGEIEKDVTGVAKSNELQKIAADMVAHLNELEKSVVANNHAKQYLDIKALPFQVVSVDVIAEQPFVSVDYQHHVLPLSVGDSLAGWKLVQADYAAVEAEFINNQGQYVKVNALAQLSSIGVKE